MKITNSSKSNETIIHSIEISPLLVVHEHIRSNKSNSHSENELDGDELKQPDLLILKLEASFEPSQKEDNERVETLTDRLEHDEKNRNPNQRVEDTKAFASDSSRRRVTITDQGHYYRAKVQGTHEFPLVSRLIRLLFQHFVPQPIEFALIHVVSPSKGCYVLLQASFQTF